MKPGLNRPGRANCYVDLYVALRAAGLLLLLLALCTACAGSIAPQLVPSLVTTPPGGITVVTWNMDAGEGDLAHLLEHLPAPYLFLLQEAHEADLRALATQAGLFVFFAPVREDLPGSRGNAIVSTLPLLNPRRIVLPRERQPRMAVAAEIDVAGERLFVVSARHGGLFAGVFRIRRPGDPGRRSGNGWPWTTSSLTFPPDGRPRPRSCRKRSGRTTTL